MNTHTLTRHRDIQNWVSAHKGQPAIARIRDDYGTVKAQLRLSFATAKRAPRDMPTQDDGMSPCSWAAWLAELDRQHLALKVADTRNPAFEFVGRSGLNGATMN